MKRQAVWRFVAMQLGEQITGGHNHAGDAIRGRGDFLGAQYRNRALDHHHDRQMRATGFIERIERFDDVGFGLNIWK